MNERKPGSQEEVMNSFRSALEDLVSVGERLKVFCGTLDEALDMAKLAITNDGQLKMLLSLTTNQPRR